MVRVDMHDVKGQAHIKRALEVAAAGGHSTMLVGAPGHGKTMLAHRINTIMPGNIRFVKVRHDLAKDVEIGRQTGNEKLVVYLENATLQDPKRLSFMGYFLEEEGVPGLFVTDCRPCPCGYKNDVRQACNCTPEQVEAWYFNLRGTILPFIQLTLEVPPLRSDELASPPAGEKSEAIRQRVSRAWDTQKERFGRSEAGTWCNAVMTDAEVEEYCPVTLDAATLVKAAITQLTLSARDITNMKRVARTICDLSEIPAPKNIGIAHIAEAVQYISIARRWVGHS